MTDRTYTTLVCWLDPYKVSASPSFRYKEAQEHDDSWCHMYKVMKIHKLTWQECYFKLSKGAKQICTATCHIIDGKL